MATEIAIPIGAGVTIDASIDGDGENGIVVFAHGSGSSRHSRRNIHVASILEADGFQTLLLDLLTTDEERVDLITREHRFDIDLLADRVVKAIDWLEGGDEVAAVGLFGASTGAAAALRAAAARPDATRAVVSRGGRPDLAGEDLARVTAPTLLIVGGNDRQVIELNRDALRHLNDASQITVVPGAGHLFEEPGKLDEVASLASNWFLRHMV